MLVQALAHAHCGYGMRVRVRAGAYAVSHVQTWHTQMHDKVLSFEWFVSLIFPSYLPVPPSTIPALNPSLVTCSLPLFASARILVSCLALPSCHVLLCPLVMARLATHTTAGEGV